jgi:ketosteroid isomerase-like protein
LIEAINKNDLDALLTHLDKDVVITWMDASVSRGPQGVKEYIEKMTKGENRKVNSHSIDAEVDELTHLYGDTGMATGTSKDQFVLTDGRDFVVNTRWTATVVKKDGKWKIASFHSSTDMFYNPVLFIAVRRTAMWVGGIAVAVGLLLGFGVAWFLRRRKPGSQPSVPR